MVVINSNIDVFAFSWLGVIALSFDGDYPKFDGSPSNFVMVPQKL